MSMKPHLVFFIGTEAELIKVFPVILACEEKGLSCAIVASGQNDIDSSFIMSNVLRRRADLVLSDEKDITKSATGLLQWFMKTKRIAKSEIQKGISVEEKPIMVVHGDTISTVMGSLVAKKLGLKVAHIEAGLRSYNWFSPFPEEIDRCIVSHYSNYHFAPSELAASMLRKKHDAKCVINTRANTLIDSFLFSQKQPCNDPHIERICKEEHCIVVLHRQENLANAALIEAVVDLAVQVSKKRKCVFVLHKPTYLVLKQKGFLEELERASNVELVPRVEYIYFMKLLASAEFVITDGGSNQEELSYMGVPSFIMRKNSERTEGLGENAVLYSGSFDAVTEFAEEYEKYRRPPFSPDYSPSDIIAEYLHALLLKDEQHTI